MPVVERLGVLGGTFDPPHNGHLALASYARSALALDRVRFVVAGQPWQKVGQRSVSDPQHRAAMVEALLEGIVGLEVDRSEIDRGGPSYMADTVASLAAPDRLLYLLLGSDAASGVLTWERVEEVRTRVVPVVVDRPGVDAANLPDGWAWRHVRMPHLEVSSTEVRARIRSDEPVDGLLPPAVISCVRELGLYCGEP